jgi:hypothetical protein
VNRAAERRNWTQICHQTSAQEDKKKDRSCIHSPRVLEDWRWKVTKKMNVIKIVGSDTKVPLCTAIATCNLHWAITPFHKTTSKFLQHAKNPTQEARSPEQMKHN